MTLDLMKSKGMDYVGEMPDDSFYTGESNQKYVDDDKKIFSLQEVVEVKDSADIQKKVRSQQYFMVGVLKKDDRIILNDLSIGRQFRKLTKDPKQVRKIKTVPEEGEVMVLPLIGWVNDDDGKLIEWIFRTGMNSNWYKDGNIKIPANSDLILKFNSLTFSMF